MGNIVFRKKKVVAEELEELQKQTVALEEQIRKTIDEKQSIQWFSSISLFFLVVVSIAISVFNVQNKSHRVLYTIGSVCGGFFLFYCFHQMTNKYYNWRIGKKKFAHEEMSKKKREILERVKETETFKVAKEILDKYDDTTKTPTPAVNSKKQGRDPLHAPRMSLPPSLPHSYQTPPAEPSEQQPWSSRQKSVDLGKTSKADDKNGAPAVSISTPLCPVVPQLKPPRPFFKQQRTVADKVVDFILGDGPSHRFALICSHCYGHNGMAREEEFNYVSYRCWICGEFNPARQQRTPFRDHASSEQNLAKLSAGDLVSLEEKSNLADAVPENVSADVNDSAKERNEEVPAVNDTGRDEELVPVETTVVASDK